MRQRHPEYRAYDKEQPPSPPEHESKVEKVKRILEGMPEAIFNNPELRLKALRRAQSGKEY
jgi:hypothetical protein